MHNSVANGSKLGERREYLVFLIERGREKAACEGKRERMRWGVGDCVLYYTMHVVSCRVSERGSCVKNEGRGG